MIHFVTELSRSHFDYRIDKPDRFYELLPYLYPKLSGDWKIELVELDINVVRDLLDHVTLPEYLDITVVLAQDVLARLQMEYPNVSAVKKTIWEYYNDLIAKLPILIDSKAASMLYNRLPRDRIVMKQTLDHLAKTCEAKGVISTSDVKAVTLNNVTVYSNQVLRAFVLCDKNRWRLYGQFELALGEDHAYYAMRKYVKKLLKEKTQYLNNEPYKDKNVEVVDTYSLIFFIGKFSTYQPGQLVCIFSEYDSIRKGESLNAIL